jgi:biopolymer transport protein ExbD
MRLSSGYEERKGRIEIVPLIDVVFLLLVFFIYAMVRMTMERGVRVNLPTASGELTERQNLVISITSSNTLEFEGRAILLPQLLPEILAERSLHADRPVVIKGDRSADLGVAVEVMARLRDVGVKSVSFLVRPENDT